MQAQSWDDWHSALTPRMDETPNWKPLSKAAEEANINQTKLSRLVKEGVIRSKKLALNKRITLVDFDQVQRLVAEEKQYIEKEDK